MNIRTVGILGVSIPLLILFGFTIFFLLSDPILYANLNNSVMGLVSYNIEGLSENKWLIYFNYLGVGLIICVFCIALMLLIKNSTSKAGVILLLISGFSWTSLGFSEINAESDSMLIKGIITLVIGAIGFTLLGGDYKLAPRYKWIIFSVGLLIILDRILDIALLFDYPHQLNQLSWILYFVGFGIIGLSLLKSAQHTI
ncbi:hypothetical protein E1176_09450 [Fulvivirga sp. RKSG066]|uniref:hypothetical protein n=1 Tax=Fulvivirga aurantia TaxID=2529383 RepID=UPI0012BCC205|nr:hypothetical protein [Fulvivirga aurantia]MTI21244.1 hypothetical protein [Fulvivirga aurantia]